MKPPEPDLVGLVCRCVAVPGLILYFLASFTAIALSIRNRRRERRAAAGEVIAPDRQQVAVAEHIEPTIELEGTAAAGAQGG